MARSHTPQDQDPADLLNDVAASAVEGDQLARVVDFLERRTAAAAPIAPATLLDLDLDDVAESTLNPRQSHDQDADALDELGASIKESGLVEPIVVRRARYTTTLQPIGAKPATWELIAGSRRWRAARRAGVRSLPARVLDVDDAAAVTMMAAENLQRHDLNPIDEAIAYQNLAKYAGLSQAAIAQRIGKKQPTIANTLRLLELPDPIKGLIRSGALTRAHGLALLRWTRHEEYLTFIANAAANSNLPVSALEKQPLPLHHDAIQAGLVVDLRYHTHPRMLEICRQCPFSAHVPPPESRSYEHGYCLKPAHYAELSAQITAEEAQAQHERTAAALAEAEAKVAAATAEAEANLRATSNLTGKQLERTLAKTIDTIKREHGAIPLADLPTKTERLHPHTTPSECSTACACRRTALDRAGSQITVCINANRLALLRGQDIRNRRKNIKQIRDDQLAQLHAHIDSRRLIDSRETAVIAIAAVNYGAYGALSPNHLRQALARRDDTTPGPDQWADLVTTAADRANLYARFNPTAIGLAIVETLLAREIDSHLADAGNPHITHQRDPSQLPPLTAWYLSPTDTGASS